MTAIHWLTAINGSFTNASDWSGGVVPGASDDAILDAPGGSPYTVTSSAIQTVDDIQTASDATLSIIGGFFDATAGTGAGANAGMIQISAGATFASAGLITNTGVISIGDGKVGAEFLINGVDTLAGGGQVILGAGGSDQLGQHTPRKDGWRLTNLDNTIAGSGRIGGKGFNLTNGAAGVIDADGKIPLTVVIGYSTLAQGRSTLVNDGVLEATNGGSLDLDLRLGVLAGGPAGIILAGDGSEVALNGVYVSGGTIETAGSGSFRLSGVTLENGVTIASQLIIQGVQLAGSVVNRGGIVIGAGFESGGVGFYDGATMTGGGVIDLGTAGGQKYLEGGGVFVNVDNTIEGAGTINNSRPMTFENEAHGVVDANGVALLTLYSQSVINAGTIETTGSGGIVDNETSIYNTGTILAAGAGGLSLAYGVENYGVLAAVADGTMTIGGAVTGSGRAMIGAGTLDFKSTFSQNVTFTGKTGVLMLAASRGYGGVIAGFSTSGKTTLDLEDIKMGGGTEATFSGTSSGGVLTVTDQIHTAHISLDGDYLSATFVTSSDGHDGIDVIAQATERSAASVQAFACTMAAFGPAVGQSVHTALRPPSRDLLLALPRAAAA